MIYEAHVVPGEGVVVREVEGQVRRVRVAAIDLSRVILEHVADAAPFTLGCVVVVHRQGVALVGYVTPTLIDRDNGILHLEGFPVLAGDELEVAEAT